jgi:hypothetical protein
MEEMIKAYKMSIEKPEVYGPHWRRMHKWESNIIAS